MRVLLVEDEPRIARAIVEGLTREGFEVSHATTLAEAREVTEPELVLLDLRLPDGDGLDFARELRRTSNVPILIITARGEEVDVIVGLEIGADDYLVKPFGVRQLLARIRAVMRRIEAEQKSSAPEVMEVGRLTIDRGSRKASVGDADVALTPREFELLACLAKSPEIVVERATIFREVWGGEWYGSRKTLDVHIGSLRRKLGDPAWIETTRGVGFSLRAL
ncbi:MAG: response regulator transcription factor [Thermoleophilia bacterium]|nr:response regulator transcription factor [Thermoleophilia bacterium]